VAKRHSLEAHDRLRDLIAFLAKFCKHVPDVHRVRIAQRAVPGVLMILSPRDNIPTPGSTERIPILADIAFAIKCN
jgi:hypothetical protein